MVFRLRQLWRYWKLPFALFSLGIAFRILCHHNSLEREENREVSGLDSLPPTTVSPTQEQTNVQKTRTTMNKVPLKPSRPDGRCNGCFNWQKPFTVTPSGLFCSPQTNLSQTLDLVVLATSKHENLKQRDMLRRTWGSYSSKTGRIRLIFVFGLDPSGDNTKEYQLQLESAREGDILQVNHRGRYRDMTHLVFNAFRWVQDQCTEAQFVAKVSDDVYLNIPSILHVLEVYGKNQLADVLFGQCYNMGATPWRDPRGENGAKWYESRKSYPYDKYPSYCSGAAMFMSTGLMMKLLPELRNVRYPLAHDDVMLGILLRLAHFCQCQIPGFSSLFLYNGEEMSKLVSTKKLESCSQFSKEKPVLALHLHAVNPEIMEHFWSHQKCLEQVSNLSIIKCPQPGQCPENYYHLPKG